MCYSIESSLVAFVLGTIGAISLPVFGPRIYSKQNTILMLMFIWGISMQLVEALLWYDVACDKGINKIVSQWLGPFLNFTQPFIYFLLLQSSSKFLERFPMYKTFLIGTFIFYFFSIIVSLSSNVQMSECTEVNSEGHLDWTWLNNGTTTWLYLFIYILTVPLFFDNLPYFLWICLTTLLCLVNIIIFPENPGELWCLTACAEPLILLVLENI